MKIPWRLLLALPLAALCFGCGALGDPSQTGGTAYADPAPALAKGAQPELAQKLVTHLRGKYPNLEVRFLHAVLSLDGKYPGLAYALPRHLMEDLGGEGAEAVADVLEAERQRYPQIGAKVAALRREGGPRRAVQEYLAGHYPGLRTEALEYLGSHPGPGRAIRKDVLEVMNDKYPDLRRQVRLEVSRLVDEKYPGLPMELLKVRSEGRRPLPYLLEQHPEFVREAARRVKDRQGPQMRAAAVDVLTRLEKDPAAQPGPWARQALDALVQAHPTLPAEVLDQRLAARARLHQEMRSQFPEALTIAVSTVRSKHPQLLARALESVGQHYPQLKTDVQAAIESELPGFREEVRGFLKAEAPELIPGE